MWLAVIGCGFDSRRVHRPTLKFRPAGPKNNRETSEALAQGVFSYMFYVGFTTNLKQRIQEHNSGKSPYTSKFKPVKLIQYSAFETEQKAVLFEKYLKSGSGIAFRGKRLV